jgi:transcriptional regulator with XRE-family HTH domain
MGMGLNGKQLAAQVGISAPYLTQLEKGLREPSGELLNKLARVLKTTPDMLMLGKKVMRTRTITHQLSRHGIESSDLKQIGVQYGEPQCQGCVMLKEELNLANEQLKRANAMLDIFIKEKGTK